MTFGFPNWHSKERQSLEKSNLLNELEVIFHYGTFRTIFPLPEPLSSFRGTRVYMDSLGDDPHLS
jgi:hypothetical protein